MGRSLWVSLLWVSLLWALQLQAVTLEFDPPTDLTNVAGYEIHYGNSSGQYSIAVDLDGPANNTVDIDPGDGTWYFAARSRNADATEVSVFSNEVSATIGEVVYGDPVPVIEWHISYTQQGEADMAVSVTGTGANYERVADGSISVTIPSDADAVVIVATGWDEESGSWLFDELNWDDGGTQDFTQIVKGSYGATNAVVSSFIMTSSDSDWPGTGSKTLYYGAVSYSEGYNIYVFYVKGLDTSDPIVDSEGTTGFQSPNWTSSLTGVGAGDLGVVAAYNYESAVDSDPTGYGQTSLIDNQNYHNADIGVGYEVGEDALRIEGASYLVPIAFALKSAASGAAAVGRLIGGGLVNAGLIGGRIAQ